MRRYSADQLRSYLRALDASLTTDQHIIVIGGAAACLAYEADRSTLDLDLWESPSRELRMLIRRTRQSSGLSLPIDVAAVADAPYEFEDRLYSLPLRGMTRLTVLVPERHDLVLMKMLRCDEHDLQTAAQIHERYPLDFGILMSRYLDEMTHVIGDPKILDMKFLALTERLFSSRQVQEAKMRLDARKR